MIQMEDMFSFGDWNQSILIAKDKAFFKDGDGIVLSGDAEVRFDLLPEPGIKIHVKNILYFDLEKTIQLSSLAFQPLDLELENIGKPIKGGMSVNNIFKSKSFVWSSHEPIVGIGNDDTQLQYVVSHLFNFKDIFTTMSLKYENWVVELQPSTKHEEHFKKLNTHGGYAFTHHIYIKKADNASFTVKEAEEMLLALFWFFSFAKGSWCAPICSVGFDSSDKSVWENWKSSRVSSFSDPISWFDELNPKQLDDLFSGFMRCWYTENLNDILRKAIYWYISSIHSNADVRIVLTQTVLEGMSFGYIVNVLKKKKADVFTRLSASIKISSLFDNLELTSYCIDGVMEDIPKLKRVTEELGWKVNALEAFVSVRNSLVHPNEKYRGKFNSHVYHETSYLGLWYIELSLLKLCNYYGKYYNRLTLKSKGEIEDVPWKYKAV